MSIDEAIKLATSVVSLMTAVIALLSMRNARLKSCEDCHGWSGTSWQSRSWPFRPSS
ncbi:hypothetical protein J3D46_005036 [Paenarthrobacter sp. A20]|nr:hypothetical protein [Paenarthrobacter sp. A20]